MTRFWIKMMALLCALLMLATMTIACADQEDSSTDTDGAGETDNTQTEQGGEDPDNIVYKANIPDGFSGGGDPFVVYTYPHDVFVWKDYDWQHSGDITGERINDAVFRRSSQVEEELDIIIEYYCGENYSNPTDFITTINAGEDAYDIGNVNMRSHISQVTQGLLVNIADIDELDLGAAWWDQNLQRDLSIYDKFFCLTGDIGTMYKRSIGTILFNKQMITEYSLNYPYELAENGEWTIECMIEMSEDVPFDIDGNDKMDQLDRYSIIYFDGVFDAMVVGADVKYATRDADGVPEMTLYSDHAVAVLEEMAELLYDDTTSYNVYRNGQNEQTMWEIFMDNRALFYYGELHSAEDKRASVSNFGIMPMPLLDEYQESYHHTVNPNVAAVIVIPTTNTEEMMTSYALDSLGAASKNILTPAYYDINLKGIVSRDEESAVSLDLIISTLSYDPGYLYVVEAGQLLRDLVHQTSDAFASKYASQESTMNTKIEKIVQAITDNYS